MADNEPPEKDMKDFEFLQLCKFRVQQPNQELPINRGNLLACSSKYGLLVYCTKQGFSTVKTSNLMKINDDLGKQRTKVIIEDIPVEKKIDLSTAALCLSFSADGKFLAVVTKDMGQLCILFYDINTFADKASPSMPFARAKVNATPSAVIQDLAWNPAIPTLLAVCSSDGNVELIDVTSTPRVIAALPAAGGATCFCWSPKGKQLLVGKKNGSAHQYDHLLAEKKVWGCPAALQGAHRVVDIMWQSAYVFMAAYLPAEASAADQPKVMLVVSNKEGKTQYLNFDDICFGNGEERKAQYFFHLISQWEVILMASSNATEATLVGKDLDNKITWEHWNLEDCSRAELPLTGDQNDTFPVGMTVDYSPQSEIVINESLQYPACPVMYLLSTDGMLLGFHLSYRHKDAPSVTSPAAGLDPTAARKEVASMPASMPAAAQKPLAAVNPPAAAVATGAAPTISSAAVAPSSSSSSGASAGGLFNLSGAGPSFQFAGIGGASTKAAPLGFSQPAAQPPNGLAAQKTAPPSLTSGAGFSLPASSASASVFSANKSFTGVGAQGGATGFMAGQQGGFGSSGFSFGTAASTPQSSAFAFVAPTTGQSQGLMGGKPGLQQTEQPQPSLSKLLSSQPAPASASPGATVTAAASSKTLPAATLAPTAEKPKPPAASLSAFTSSKPVTAAQPAPTAPAVSVPQAVSTPTAPGPLATTLTPKQQGPVASKEGAQSHSLESQKSIDARLDSAFTHNIIEEIRDFENELKQLRGRARSSVKTVGTREEMQQLRQDTERMANFTKDIKTVTKDQLREAQEQKGTSFNLLAMGEECRVKQERDQDPHYHSLLQGRTLDPASAERLKRLQGMAQALEQRVVEVDSILDAQWAEHQAKRKKEERLATPTGDIIYKTIKNNHNLITDQRRKLDKVEEQLQNLRLYTRSGAKDLQALSMSNGEPMPGLMEGPQPERTLQQAVSAGMTPDKVSRLRDLLSQRAVPLVKSSPLANLSMSRIVAHTPPSSGKSPSQSRSNQQQQQQRQPQKLGTPTGPPLSQLTAPTGKLSFVTDKYNGHLPQQQQPQQSPQQKQIFTAGQKLGPGAPTMFGGGIVPQQPEQQKQQLQQQLQQLQQQQQQQQKQLQQQQQQLLQQQRLAGPTSFSGMAFFKQPSPLAAGVTATRGQGAAGGQLPAASEMGVVPPASATATAGAVQAGLNPSVQAAQLLQPNMYEDVTPTETEEDEEDGYDDEEGGYEDEDEDEEETGFAGMAGSTAVTSAFSYSGGGDGPGGDAVGLFKVPPVPGTATAQQGFAPLRSTTQAWPLRPDLAATTTSVSAAATSTSATNSARQVASKDLFGAKFSAVKTDESAAHTRSGSIGFNFGSSDSATTTTGPATTVTTTTTAAAAGASLFSFGKTSAGFGGSGVGVSASQQAVTTTAGQIAASRADGGGSSLFKLNTEAKSGFSFGGPAQFDQKVAAASAAGIQGSVFGAQATPSKNVGFGDLSKPVEGKQDDAQPAKPDSQAQTSSTAMPSPSATTAATTATATAAAATALAVSTAAAATQPAASGFTFSLPGSSSAGGSSTFGGGKPESNIPSVFGGKSGATSGGTFSFNTSPSPSSTAVDFSFTSALGSASSSASAPAGGLGVASALQGVSQPESTTVTSPGAQTPSLFGGGTAAKDQPAPSFGAPTSQPTTSTPAFVVAPDSSTATAKSPLFGSSSSGGGSATPAAGEMPSSTTGVASGLSSGAGGSAASPPTTGGGLFGKPASMGQAQPGSASTSDLTTPQAAPPPVVSSPAPLFGGGSVSTLPGGTASTIDGGAPSLFGKPLGTAFGTAVGSPSGTGLFGSSPANTSGSATGLFGGGSSGSSTGGIFGSSAAKTQASTGLFGGGGASTPASSGGGLFGSSTPSVFGSGATAVGSEGTGLFGAPASSSSSSSAATGGLFGGGGSSMGGTGMVESAKTSAAPSGLFGSSAGGGLFGQQQTSSSSGFGFGQQTTSASSFGQPSPFGQQAPSSSSGLLGFTGLGGKPSEEKAKQNVFGVSQTFGSTGNQNAGLFGSGGSSTFGGFGSPASASPGGGGSFSSGGGGVGSSGFGVALSQPSAGSGGFGTSPSFGNSPSFGGSAVFGSKPAFASNSPGGAFGSAPTFGSSPAFGSSTFGSAAGAGGVGGGPSAPGSSGAGFSSFANAAAPSFGQLAQSSTSTFGGGSGFGASPQASAQPFGGGGGGFGSQAQPVFGQGMGQGMTSPGFGGGGGGGGGGTPQSGFGGAPSFGSSPAFSSYRG